MYLTDIFIFLLFVLWLLFEIRAKKIKNHLRQVKKNLKPFLISFAFIVFLAIGILFSKNPMAGWYGFLKLLEFLFFGFYTVFNIYRFKVDTILTIFSIGIIFESSLSILQYLNQHSLGGIFYFFGERTFNGQTPGIANASLNGELVLRPYGTFSHPNVLSAYLLLGMIILIYNLNFKIINLQTLLDIASLFLGTIALFLTMGRIAILIWVLVVLVLGIRNFYKERKRAFYFLLPIILLILAFLYTPIYSRFSNLNFSDETVVLRENLIKDSLIMIKKYPIFGTGINNFLNELPGFYLQPVHNIYLLIGSQTGIIGFVAFFWFIIKTYRNLRFTLARLAIYDFRFTILSAVLILGFFDHYFLTLQQGQLLFAFVFGLCWARTKYDK